jgi:glycosyltransferase involved in cell wall biosynthesis
MNIAIVIGSMRVETGGPPSVVKSHVKILADKGHLVTVLATNDLKKIDPQLRHAFSYRVFFCDYPALDQFDGVFFHGIWHLEFAFFAKALRKRSIPYSLFAHGMLDPWSISSSRLKKQVFSWMPVCSDLVTGAHSLIFGTDVELENASSLFSYKSKKIIPNTSFFGSDDMIAAGAKVYSENSPRKILFLSRYHAKKGLKEFISAFSMLDKSIQQRLEVICVGLSHDSNYENECRQLAGEVASPDSIKFLDVSGDDARSMLLSSHALVLPSFQEGLSMSLIEALLVGRVILMSDRCNLNVLESEGAAFVFDLSQQCIAEMLVKFSEVELENLAKMSAASLKFSHKYFSPDAVGDKLLTIISEMSGSK